MTKFKKVLNIIVKYGGWVVAAATWLLNHLPQADPTLP
jgi:hypothetical protein